MFRFSCCTRRLGVAAPTCSSVASLEFWKGSRPVQVIVHDKDVDQALKALKKKMQRGGVLPMKRPSI